MNEGYIIAAKDLPVDSKKKKEGKFTIYIAWPILRYYICEILPKPYLRVSTPLQGAIINALQLT